MYAAGKIPGGFFKREGKASERATLTARMIDRPIRPLWPKGFRNEVQVICTVLSADMVHGHDVLCINGASAALAISPLPFLGPVGAVRVARIDGELVVNPTLQEADEDSDLDLIVVGTRDALTMIEAGADQVPEDTMLLAFELAHTEIKRICDVIDDLREQVGKPKWVDPALTAELESDARRRDLAAHPGAGPEGRRARSSTRSSTRSAPTSRSTRPRTTWSRRCRSRAGSRSCSTSSASSPSKARCASSSRATCKELTDAEQDSKYLKSRKRGMLYDSIVEGVKLPFPVSDGESDEKDATTKAWVKKAADAVYKDIVRKKIAVDKRRPDGRGTEEIRPISVEVGFAPRTHGSGLFTRGETQILTLCTLGTAKEGQRIDDLSLEQDRHYIHHYNFPPYSVGETGFMRGPKRRDIGHGALAQRALEAVIPSPEDFPYTIRLVSETLESNGSSSMGSVCGSTMSMMDAGVPIKAPVSGIAMGLVKEGDDYVILTDIQGAEDHLGDMDFKVAGTEDGITALQMDIKITGVTHEIMSNALAAGEAGTHRDPRQDGRGDLRAAGRARRARAAHLDGADQPRVHRHGDRQGRRDDPRPRGRLRRADRHRAKTARSSSTRPRARRATPPLRRSPLSRSRRRWGTPTPARSSRRPSSAPSSSSRRAPTACSTSRTSARAASLTSRTSWHVATSST